MTEEGAGKKFSIFQVQSPFQDACCVWSEHRCVYTNLIHDSSSPSE